MAAQILIFSLHRIGYPPPNATHRGLFTTPRLLAFQLRMLRILGFQFATLRDAMEADDGKVAVITFDDGYADNIAEGLPVLEKFNAPATVFVITGDVGAKNLSWEEAGEKLPADFMTWDELRSLSAKGWEIGSHAHNHIHLSGYSRARQAREIVRSVREIEDNIGESPVSFAYPYGSYDRRTKSILARAGFANAVTTEPVARDASGESRERLSLGRIALGGRNLDHYIRAIYRVIDALGLGILRPARSGIRRVIPARPVIAEFP